MKQVLLLSLIAIACDSVDRQIECPTFSAFTEVAFQVADNQDTIYYHEFNEDLFDSTFVNQFRNELDYLLINYSSFNEPSLGDTNISFQRNFQITLAESNLNNLLCQLYKGYNGIGDKVTISKAQLMEISSRVFYSDSIHRRICLRVDGAYPLENPFIEAFCVSTILLDLTSGDEFPSYYEDFLNTEETTSFQERIRTNKELESLLLNRYQALEPKLTFRVK